MYWQLHREFGLRLIAQTSGTSEDPSTELSSSYLLTWMRHPGTEAYLGATQVIDWEQGGIMEQVLFAKLSWWFQT